MSIFLLFELSGCIYNILLMGIFIRGFFCLKDDVNKYLLFLSQVLFCIILFTFSIIPTLVLPRVLCTLTIFTLTVFLFYKASLLQSVFSAFSFYSLVSITDLISMGVLNYSGIPIKQMMSSDIERIIYIFNSNFLYTFTIIFVISFSRKNQKSFSIKRGFPILLCEFFCVLVCYFVLRQCIFSSPDFWMIIYLLVLLYLNITFILYTELIQANTYKQHVYEMDRQQFLSQKAYYQKLYESQEEIQALWHDIKKYVQAMDAACMSQDPQSAARAIISQTQNALDSITPIVNTGNKQIDMILTNYLSLAKEHKVDVDMDISISPSLSISPVDLYIIIGNTFDNAIEACIGLSFEQRKIEIKLKTQGSMILYSIKNPCSSKKHHLSDGHHGYGLKNVRTCIKKYNGTLSITQDSFFQCTIRLNFCTPSIAHEEIRRPPKS